MKHDFLSLIKKELFSYSIHFYYFTGILFCLVPSIGFFFGSRFFVLDQASPKLSSFFLIFPYISTVVLPTLCMNVKDRRFDKTLPFSSLALILSRFTSALIVFIIFLLPSVLVPVSVNFFTDVDFGAVLVSYAGIVFYGILGISFCLFMYELIEQKALYFVITVLSLALINSIHSVLLNFPVSEFWTKIIQSVSFSWHFDSAGKGVLDTRDFFYFLILSAFFLCLAYACSEAKKGKSFFKGKALGKTILVLLVFILCLLNTRRFYKRFDFSKSGIYSLSPYTEKLISNTEEKVRITYYRSKELVKMNPQVKDVSDLLYSFALENRNVSFSLVNADSPESLQNLERLGIRPFQLQTVNKNHLEYIQVYSSIVIEYLDETEIIPVILSSVSLEYDLALRLDYLINGNKRYVYFVSGNGDNSEGDFETVLKWLSLEGIEPLFIDGTKKESDSLLDKLNEKYPLVLSGTKNLTLNASRIIESFVMKGGKAIVLTSPYDAKIKGDWSIEKIKNDHFLPVLKNWGIHFDDAICEDISNVRISFYSSQNGSESENQFGQKDTDYKYMNYPMWINVLPQENVRDGIFAFWPSPVILLDDNAVPLFKTSDYSWILHEDYQGENIFDTNPFTVSQTFEESSLTEKKKSVIGVLLNGKITGYYEEGVNEKATCIVISDQYFVSELSLTMAGGENGDFRNLSFLSESLLKLNGDEGLSELKNKDVQGQGLYKIMDEEKFLSTEAFVLRLNVILVPLFFIAFNIFMIVLRKKRNV